MNLIVLIVVVALLAGCAVHGATCMPKVKARHDAYFAGVRCGW